MANTIGYRKRKGTASVLEQMAGDVTGWDARAVEFFRLLITAQNLNHSRLWNLATMDLRQWEPLELLGKAFESSAHTADVRHISSARGRRGRYNIPNIGIFLWRLKSYSVTDSLSPPVFGNDYRRYMFSPLGNNTQLFGRSLDRSGGAASSKDSAGKSSPCLSAVRCLAAIRTCTTDRERAFAVGRMEVLF